MEAPFSTAWFSMWTKPRETIRKIVDIDPYRHVMLTMLFWLFILIEFVLGIWGFIVTLKCLGEVQGFSAWKAFGNTLLAGLVILVPILGIVALVMLAT